LPLIHFGDISFIYKGTNIELTPVTIPSIVRPVIINGILPISVIEALKIKIASRNINALYLLNRFEISLLRKEPIMHPIGKQDVISPSISFAYDEPSIQLYYL
jgi:hypothetical protein